MKKYIITNDKERFIQDDLNESYEMEYVVWVLDGDDNQWKKYKGAHTDEINKDAFLKSINYKVYPNFDVASNFVDVKVLPAGKSPMDESCGKTTDGKTIEGEFSKDGKTFTDKDGNEYPVNDGGEIIDESIKEAKGQEKLFYCQVRTPYKYDDFFEISNYARAFKQNSLYKDSQFSWLKQYVKGDYISRKITRDYSIGTTPNIDEAFKLTKQEWLEDFASVGVDNPGRFFSFIPALPEGIKYIRVYFEKQNAPGTLTLADIKRDLKRSNFNVISVESGSYSSAYSRDMYRYSIINVQIDSDEDLNRLNSFIAAKIPVADIGFSCPGRHSSCCDKKLATSDMIISNSKNDLDESTINFKEENTSKNQDEYSNIKINVYDIKKFVEQNTDGKYTPFDFHTGAAILFKPDGSGCIVDFEAIGESFNSINDTIVLRLNDVPEKGKFYIMPQYDADVTIKEIIDSAPEKTMTVDEFFTKRNYNSRCIQNFDDIKEYLK